MDELTVSQVLTKDNVESANQVLSSVVTHTPLQFDAYLSQKYGCQVYLKREDLQIIRSFKLRGAYYAIAKTPVSERKRGVVCASAGNHAQGVAWTAHQMGIPAVIFMPTTTPKQKIDQVRFFGQDNVNIQLIGDTFDAAAQAANEYCKAHQMVFIAPFDDLRTMAGQGTAALEMLADADQMGLSIDYLFAAIGGGGLISGLAAYTKAVSPKTQVVGVEPYGAASMAAAFQHGHPVTLKNIDKFVDGAAVKTVGNLTYLNAHQYVDELVSVAEGHVCTTILELYSKSAIVAEPAGALSVATLDQMGERLRGKTVVCVISGGNNDIDRMQEIKERSLVYEGQQQYFLVNFPQRPNALREFIASVMDDDDDITKFEYTKRVNRGVGPVLIGIRLGQVANLPSLRRHLLEYDPRYIDLKENQMLYEMLV